MYNGSDAALLQQQLLDRATSGQQGGFSAPPGPTGLNSMHGMNQSALASLGHALGAGLLGLGNGAGDQPVHPYKSASNAMSGLSAPVTGQADTQQVQDFIGWLQTAAYNPGAATYADVKPVLPQASAPAVLHAQTPVTAGVPSVQPSRPSHNDDEVQNLLGKVQRRLQQNRESARKCRQRKKEYMRQLEGELAILQAKQKSEAEANTTGAVRPSGVSGLQQQLSSSAATPASPALQPPPPPPQQLQQGADLGQQLLQQGADVGAASPAAPVHNGCALQALLAWRTEFDGAMADLAGHLHVGADEKVVQPMVDTCLQLLQRQRTLMEEALRSDMFAVLAGHHMLPQERLVLWMGGMRPSEVIQLVVRELTPRGLLQGSQRDAMARLREAWSHQENTLEHGFSQLRSSLSQLLLAPEDHTMDMDPTSGPDDAAHHASLSGAAASPASSSPSPQMLGKLDAMRMLLLRAEAFRGDYHARLREVLGPRAFAWSLVLPAVLAERLRQLCAASAEH